MTENGHLSKTGHPFADGPLRAPRWALEQHPRQTALSGPLRRTDIEVLNHSPRLPVRLAWGVVDFGQVSIFNHPALHRGK